MTSPGTVCEYSAFISCSTPDREKAEEICGRLEKDGRRCWIAPRDVRAGMEYANEIIRGIEQSKSLVLVLSSAANASAFVGREVERAVTKGRPVIPIRIEPVMPSSGLELFVSATQWIDASSGNWSDHLDRLARVVAGNIEPASSTKRAFHSQKGKPKWGFRQWAGTAAVLLWIVLAMAYENERNDTADSGETGFTQSDPVTPLPKTDENASVSKGNLSHPPDAEPPGPKLSGWSPVAAPETKPAIEESAAPDERAANAVDHEALQDLFEEATAVAVRAQVVDASLSLLAEQMRPDGLRSDIVARWRSLGAALAGAERALDEGDVRAATNYFEHARHDVELLERFLGR